MLDPDEFAKLRMFTVKQREGRVDRVSDSRTLIVRDLFHKGTNFAPFLNMRVERVLTGDVGRIESAFGQTGKTKVTFNQDAKKVELQPGQEDVIRLTFKKYAFDKTHKMVQ